MTGCVSVGLALGTSGVACRGSVVAHGAPLGPVLGLTMQWKGRYLVCGTAQEAAEVFFGEVCLLLLQQVGLHKLLP